MVAPTEVEEVAAKPSRVRWGHRSDREKRCKMGWAETSKLLDE